MRDYWWSALGHPSCSRQCSRGIDFLTQFCLDMCLLASFSFSWFFAFPGPVMSACAIPNLLYIRQTLWRSLWYALRFFPLPYFSRAVSQRKVWFSTQRTPILSLLNQHLLSWLSFAQIWPSFETLKNQLSFAAACATAAYCLSILLPCSFKRHSKKQRSSGSWCQLDYSCYPLHPCLRFLLFFPPQ